MIRLPVYTCQLHYPPQSVEFRVGAGVKGPAAPPHIIIIIIVMVMIIILIIMIIIVIILLEGTQGFES